MGGLAVSLEPTTLKQSVTVRKCTATPCSQTVFTHLAHRHPEIVQLSHASRLGQCFGGLFDTRWGTCRNSGSPIDDYLQALSTASRFKAHSPPLWADNNLDLS